MGGDTFGTLEAPQRRIEGVSAAPFRVRPGFAFDSDGQELPGDHGESREQDDGMDRVLEALERDLP